MEPLIYCDMGETRYLRHFHLDARDGLHSLRPGSESWVLRVDEQSTLPPSIDR